MKRIELELNPLRNGVMLIWEEIEKCTIYRVKLYARKNVTIVDKKNIYDYENHFKPEQKIEMIKANLIDEIEVERTRKYLCLKDLAQLKVEFRFFVKRYQYKDEAKKIYDKGYFVEVIAEDKNGNEIAKSDLMNFGPGDDKSNFVYYGRNQVVC